MYQDTPTLSEIEGWVESLTEVYSHVLTVRLEVASTCQHSQAKSDCSACAGTSVEGPEHMLVVEGDPSAPAEVQAGWLKNS